MRLYFLILLTVLSSCEERGDHGSMSEESARLTAIVGTWKSDPVVEGRFEKSIIMTFTDDGRVFTRHEFTNRRTGGISGVDMEETYKIRDGIIYMNCGWYKAEIPYRVKGATMRLLLGSEYYALKRQAEHGEGGKTSPATS